MANTTYQSPVISNANQRRIAYETAIELFQHLATATAASPYNGINIVTLDFSVTAANRVTLTTSDPIPDFAARFPGRLTLVP